jgi:phage terminase large subunit-like protein
MNLESRELARKRRPTKSAADARRRDHSAIARGWEDDVLSGRIPMGELVRKAIERQRADIAGPPAGYAWNAEEADKACALAEELAFPKGPKRGQRFHLEPWQIWFLGCIFGWQDATTGLPRFHKVTAFIPKGNGKSPLAAAIGCIVIARGRNTGAKVYSAAVTEKQANNVFQPAQEMLRQSPKVLEAAQLVVTEHAIKGIGDPRIFERVSAEKRSADGAVPDCMIVDEVHQHPTRALYDVVSNNASKVDGSRVVAISTGGTDPSPTSIGWLLYCEVRDILTGKFDAPAHFAVIFEADRDLDPWEESTWRQANPNYGISISARNFRTTAEAARADPTAQPHFFATRLGWWSRGADKWMDLARWDAAAADIGEEQFAGRKVFLGIDYAPKLDFSAIVEVAASLREDGRRQYVVRSHGFLPERSPTLHDLPALRNMVPGWLTLTPGDSLDAGTLRPSILALVKRYPGAEVCLDPFGCVELMTSLDREGVPPFEIRQQWKFHSPAMTEVQVALSQGRLVHDGSPLMALCMANVVASPDRNGNVTPGRDNDAKKIDLAVALLNAMYRAFTVDLSIPTGPGLSVVSAEDDVPATDATSAEAERERNFPWGDE